MSNDTDCNCFHNLGEMEECWTGRLETSKDMEMSLEWFWHNSDERWLKRKREVEEMEETHVDDSLMKFSSQGERR